jgi:hypothetical protein
MTLFKSLLLGSAAGIVAIAGASAADLPSKKAAPVNYVKICDAYGAGFFTIPGTDTCVKLGGRVRYDVAYAPKGTYYGNQAAVTAYNATTSAATSTAPTAPAQYNDNGKKSAIPQDTFGQHVRGRIDLDARTPTDFGTVRSVVVMKLSQSTGLLGGKPSPYKAVDTDDVAGFGSSVPSLELAYVQFMGFTAGRAKELFADGPSLSFGANSHFPSFASGALQFAYTAVLGGGFSATVGIEDNSDHKQQNAAAKFEAPFTTPYDSLPVIVGNVAYDQSWGRIQLSGAVSRNRTQSLGGLYRTTDTDFDITKNGYAYAAFLTLNADMIGKGDKFWLLGGYSSGITSLGFKDASNASSNNARDIDGIAQSYKNFTCLQTNTTTTSAAPAYSTSCQNTNSTWVSTAFTHYWTPTVRQNLMAGMAWVDPGSIARASSAATQKATFSSIGTNLIWSPTKGLDIGVEVLYNRASVGNDTSDAVRNTLNSVGALGCKYTGANLTAGTTVNPAVASGCSSSGDQIISRVRIERTF